MKLTVEFEFCASHTLVGQGMCARMHGHNYVFLVEVTGLIDPKTGLVTDFHDIETVVEREVITKVDHRHLNDFLVKPTAEVMLVWFWDLLSPHLPVSALTLYETRRYSAVYHGEAEVSVEFAPGYQPE